jgi:hypothetical protein
MLNTKLYSPPNNDFPQGLPDYWKFDNGMVRTDLKNLNTRQLNELGWTGPYTNPVPKNPDDDTQPYDYDPTKQKYIWNGSELRFYIIDLDEDEIEFLNSINLPQPPQPPEPSQPNWELFERIVLRNTSVSELLLAAAAKNPLVASAFPASFYMTKLGDFASFRLIWKELMRYVEVYPQVVQDTINLAIGCHLPQEFIDIIADYLPPQD